MSEHKEGDLRVWHVPQIGMSNDFVVGVPDVPTAANLLVTLANYDLYLLKHNLREGPERTLSRMNPTTQLRRSSDSGLL